MTIEPEPTIYIPLDPTIPAASLQNASFVVRTMTPAMRLGASAQVAIGSLDGDVPVFDVAAMTGLVADAVRPQRVGMLLLTVFAVIATVLSSIGIFGVVSYNVARRTPEIGVRVALGASRGNIIRLVLRQGLGLTTLGAATGTVLAILATRLIAHEITIDTHYPAIYVLGFALVFAVAIPASYVPARHATDIDPMVAVRS